MPQNRQRRSERHREPAYKAQPVAPGFPGQPSAQRYEKARASYGDEYAPLEPVYSPNEDQAYEPLPDSWEEIAPRRRFGLYHAVFFVSLLMIAGMAFSTRYMGATPPFVTACSPRFGVWKRPRVSVPV